MNKTLITSLATLIAGLLKMALGIELPQEDIEITLNVLMTVGGAIGTLYGVWKRKKS